MIGAAISREVIEELAEDIRTANSPNSAIAILQQYELNVMGRLDPNNLHPEDAKEISQCMSLRDIFQSVRKRVWASTPLPNVFPEMLRPFGEETLEHPQSDMGVVVENDADIQGIQEWMKSRLQDTSVSFDKRSWFDGPASINIFSASDISSELLELLLQEK